jgi:hypothetical protein
VALERFERNGPLDIVVADANANSVAVLLGDGQGGFVIASNFLVGLNPAAIATGNLDDDGLPDLAVVNSGSDNVSILLSQ